MDFRYFYSHSLYLLFVAILIIINEDSQEVSYITESANTNNYIIIMFSTASTNHKQHYTLLALSAMIDDDVITQ